MPPCASACHVPDARSWRSEIPRAPEPPPQLPPTMLRESASDRDVTSASARSVGRSSPCRPICQTLTNLLGPFLRNHALASTNLSDSDKFRRREPCVGGRGPHDRAPVVRRATDDKRRSSVPPAQFDTLSPQVINEIGKHTSELQSLRHL